MATILIVDDMPIFREPIEVVLRAEGFDTATASNGQEALIAISKNKPDLILLDLGMPSMDGITCLRAIRSNVTFKTTPVIVLSAESDRVRILEAVQLGISGYLLKSGFSLKTMLEKVRETLVQSRSAPMPKSPAATSKSVRESVHSPPMSMKAVAAAPSLVIDRPQPASKAGTPEPEYRTASPAAESACLSVVDIKSLKPIVTRSDLLERLKSCEELKGFSPTVSQVLALTASPNSSLDAVTKAVRQDQAMALKILKIANSSVYSRGDRVDTVHKAILRIGMESIRQAVLNIGVVERFSSPAFTEQLNTAQFWEHSIACGIIAAEIAHATDGQQADSAFTCGLLHDLGRVIFAEVLGQEYINVIKVAKQLEAPLELIESRLLLLNHADVMDRLLHAWKFPKHLVEPIMYHHLSAGNVRSVAPMRVPEILRLGLADRLSHAMLLGNSGNETIYPTEDHCRVLGLSTATIQSIEETAKTQTDNTKFALISNTSGNAWPRRAEQLRETLITHIRPLYISVLPQFDAYRIFCAALAGSDVEDVPNLAVVHISSIKEIASLAELLQAAEHDAGVSRLPIIVLGSGQAALDAATLEGRTVQCLSTPFTVSRFIKAANTLLTTH